MRKERRNLKGGAGGLEDIGQRRSNHRVGIVLFIIYYTKFFNKYFIKYLYLKKLINAGIIL